jgi:hypothetical protein
VVYTQRTLLFPRYKHKEHYYSHDIYTQNTIIPTVYAHRTLLFSRCIQTERYYSHDINTKNAIIPRYIHKERYYSHDIYKQKAIIPTTYTGTYRTPLFSQYIHTERYYSHSMYTQNAIIPTVYTHTQRYYSYVTRHTFALFFVCCYKRLCTNIPPTLQRQIMLKMYFTAC